MDRPQRRNIALKPDHGGHCRKTRSEANAASEGIPPPHPARGEVLRRAVRTVPACAHFTTRTPAPILYGFTGTTGHRTYVPHSRRLLNFTRHRGGCMADRPEPASPP